MLGKTFKKCKELNAPDGCILRGVLYDVGGYVTYIFSSSGKGPYDVSEDSLMVIIQNEKDPNQEDTTKIRFPVGEWLQGKDKLVELENWVTCLNSPWSIEDERITVEYNVYDGYSKEMPAGGQFRAVYEVTGYEAVTALLIGYSGVSFEVAMANCLNWHKELQAKYNPDNESF